MKEYEMFNCCFCNKPIEVKFIDSSVVSSEVYCLVGDWISHNNCLDKNLKEYESNNRHRNKLSD